MATYDIIVLGLGGFGSSACYHAARRGASVLGLEQFTPAHDRGSSHGETRIIRQAYFEHSDYVPLLIHAYDLWDDLEQQTERKLFHKVGLMISGRPDGEAVPGTRLAAIEHKLPLESMTAHDAERRFPAFRVPEDHDVVFEANAGYLKVEDCTQAHLDMAERHGADLRFQTTVTSWESDGRTITVRTDREEFTGKQLILAAGAWSSRCLDGLNVPLNVVRKYLAWFPVRSEQQSVIEQGPTFFYEQGMRHFYGFPSIDGATLKMAEHTGGQPVDDPLTVDRSQSPADFEPLSQFLQQAIPGVEPIPARHSVCMYTRTPDLHFIVDRHPRFDNVVIACGFSGHGYKFTSAVGDVLAELALAGKTSLPIDFLSLKRPALQISERGMSVP